MASESVPMQNPPSVPALASQSSEPVHSVLHPTQPDSEAITVENAREGAKVDESEAPNSQPLSASSIEPSLDAPVASLEPQAPVAAPVEKAEAKEQSEKDQSEKKEVEKEEPQTGEKRDLDATTTPPVAPTAPASAAEETDKLDPTAPVVEKTEEPEAKKQKLETGAESTEEPAEEPEAAAPAPPAADDANGEPKKTSRPKKEKVKDVIKKAVSAEGIGSRTRSRTKAD
ncbi:hypothetical protein N7520_008120 [Penicillium odoratum]|uniref:uncharacterized protein n=1 Tax=Penicillium odoratum TaxID=1167516 RepID=UPI0025481DE4|nr:uncharacterized protein N7520_008120 [Penicillium odoratum]KAJ5760964.1 hypothetical protein N7520_008120 [Penicillium odoratum]